MSTSAQRPPSRTQIADLRASLRNGSDKSKFDKAPPAPKKPKQTSADFANERAEKAERQSMHHHTTSLLTGKAGKPYVRKGERRQSSGTILGLLFQILFVVIAVGIGAWVIDPTIVPHEWNNLANEIISQIKHHEMLRHWSPN